MICSGVNRYTWYCYDSHDEDFVLLWREIPELMKDKVDEC
jgi:hypothetical protein